MSRLPAGPLSLAELPPDVAAVIEEFRTCELSTLARDGTPITWPTLPFWEPASGRFLITTSIGLAQKALNARRDRRVSLLFCLLAEFDSAVLTGRYEQGYPFSLRCHPAPQADEMVLRLELGATLPLRAGPASLLCHRHDQQLWNQKAFLLRGSLARDERGWLFRPTQLVPGAGIGGLRGLLLFVISSRRTAARYLAARGLPRPRIPWAEIEAVKREVEREEARSRR